MFIDAEMARRILHRLVYNNDRPHDEIDRKIVEEIEKSYPTMGKKYKFFLEVEDVAVAQRTV